MTNESPTTEPPLLETICSECEGSGGYYSLSEWEGFPFCDGRGYVPTALGQQFVALMAHKFKWVREGLESH